MKSSRNVSVFQISLPFLNQKEASCTLFSAEKLLRTYFVGSNLSLRLLENYEENEKRHTRVTLIMVRAIIVAVAMMFSLSAVFPISYVFFQVPQPDQWTLPIEYQ